MGTQDATRRTARIPRRALAALAVLAALGAAGCGGTNGRPDSETAPPDSGPAWAYDEVYEGDGRLTDVIAAAPGDYWAAGSAPGASGPSPEDGYLLRGDGRHWRRQAMPGALGGSVHEARFDPLGTDGFLLTASLPGGDGPRSVRRDGTRWTALPGPPAGRVVDVRGFAADDIHVLDARSRVHHWDGARWSTARLPVRASALGGVAPDDLWAVGSRATGDGGAAGASRPAAAHWDGRKWREVPTPEHRFPEPVPAAPRASLHAVMALARNDIRAYGTRAPGGGLAEEAVRLRWDGTRWNREPDWAGDCAARVPVARDGTRGLFLDGGRYLAADGTCTRIGRPRLPDGHGVRPSSRQSLRLRAIEPVPGTDEVIGVGYVRADQPGGPAERAVIVTLKR